jgi:hypothetical protein
MGSPMPLSSGKLRAALVALLALTTGAGISSSAAYADSGSIQIWELKGGWSGRQVGLIANADLSALAISLR